MHSNQSSSRWAKPILAATVCVAGIGSAQAAFVTTRVALGTTDTILWGQLGTDSASVPSPAALTSIGGASASVSAGSDLTRFDEGGGTFAGNFAVGDQLLSNFGFDGSITVDFALPVARVGSQLTSFDLGTFTGLIEVFDAGSTLLESFAVPGVSNGAMDNSALFLGVARASADIDHVVFSIRGTDQSHFDFALNQVSFSTVGTGGGGNGVPEPASAVLAAIGLLSLTRRRR